MVKVDDTTPVATGLTENDVKKLYNMGYRNFIAGDYAEAADALQEVCRYNAVSFGEKNEKCADALLLYGRCLLELGRAENCVLGNALKGWSQIEYDSQENITSEQFEDPETVSPAEREKLRDEVTSAMAEPETIEEEADAEKVAEKPAEEKAESMETEKKEVVEPPSTEKMDEDKPAEKKDEEPSTEQDSLAEDPDSIPSLQLAWEMIELARIIYKQREESTERDVKISECYLRLGEVGMEIENYSGAVGDFLECQVLQKKHFDDLDRRIAETHYHLGAAYSFQKRHDNAKEHFTTARQMILDKIDALTTKFDDETEKETVAKVLNDLANEIAQLKDILPDLNSKLEDIEASMKTETSFEKVAEHLSKEKVADGDAGSIQHLVKRKQEELEKMESNTEKKPKVSA
jgi:nuclear autoantigenic sperm protein